MYRSIRGGFGKLVNKHGIGVLFTRWFPTLLGYSAQGVFKFGFYESSSYLIRVYWDTNTRENQTLIYLTGSASAEFIADIALCPFEAVKIWVQTQSGFTKGFLEVLAEILAFEGFRWPTALNEPQQPYPSHHSLQHFHYSSDQHCI